MFDLSRIDRVKIGVLGDLAMDIYWYADMTKSELSRETPHHPLPVVREVMSLGAAGNLAANIAALEPASLHICGVRGDDWRGELLTAHLRKINADTAGLITEPGRFTQAYCKPMRMGLSDVVYEDPRVDFAATSPISEKTEAAVLRWLDEMDGTLDALCVCDQFACGIVTDAVLARLSSMKTPLYVDSRSRIGAFRVKGVLKPNEVECAAGLRALGMTPPDTPAMQARALSKATGAAVLMTLGEAGSIYADGDAAPVHTDAVHVSGEVDICGAGDTSMAAFSACMAAGAKPCEAAEIAALASAVTVKKLAATGTASRAEILAAAN